MALQGKPGPAPKKPPIPQGGMPGTGNPSPSKTMVGTSAQNKATPGQRTWPKKTS